MIIKYDVNEFVVFVSILKLTILLGFIKLKLLVRLVISTVSDSDSESRFSGSVIGSYSFRLRTFNCIS